MFLLVILSGSTTSQTDYSLPNLILMSVYVALTLVIAIAAIWSALITRSALKTSSQLSREALAASDRQSKDAIEAVNRQIEASETQSRAAIDAVQKQIDASGRQAKEALYNQHKPIVIPISGPSSKDEYNSRYRHNLKLLLDLQNKGVGVALNVFAVMAIKGLPEIFCSVSARILVQDADKPTQFDFSHRGELKYPYNVF